MNFSVIICTYNRAESLRKTLESLEKMTVPPSVSWELLVVDNNSSDATKDLIEEYQPRKILPIHYLFEGKQGLSHARNAGVRRAKGEFVAFTDDDCLVDKNWLACLSKEFEADPAISGIGGRVELYDAQDKPITIRTLKTRTLIASCHLFGLIPGCNMAYRRSVFDSVGFFDQSFGAGTKLAFEDGDFVYRALKDGFKIVYSPAVLVYHNHGRRTDEEVRALNRWYVIGRGGFYCKHILAGDLYIVKMAYWECYALLKEVFEKLFCGLSAKAEAALLWYLFRGAIQELINKCSQIVRMGKAAPFSLRVKTTGS